MKKIIKNPIFTFIIGLVLAGSVVGVVAYNYNAKDIKYNPSDDSWNVNNVEDAINDLKKKDVLEINSGPYFLGSKWGITNNDLMTIDIQGYNKLTYKSNSGSIGKWYRCRIYVDDILLETVSDTNTHTYDLNNNQKLRLNYFTINGLQEGSETVYLKLE